MSSRRVLAGIDIGGTNVKFGLIDPDGTILWRDQKPTLAEKGAKPLLHMIGNIGESLLLHAAEEEWEVPHLGVGTPGAVDFKTGKIIGRSPNIEGWEGTELGSYLKERLNIPVYVDNDANAMALAEAQLGAARGAATVLCVTLGTGVGGAFVIDGHIFRGDNYSAGEIGHVPINFDGPKCRCGNHGCIEAYASSSAITGRAKQLLAKELTPVFEGLLDNGLDGLTIKKLFAAAAKDDPVALQVIDETAEYLGIGLGGIVNLLNPQIVVMGGGIIDGGEGLLEKIGENIKDFAFDSAVEGLKVVKASLGNDSGFIGAALLGENLS